MDGDIENVLKSLKKVLRKNLDGWPVTVIQWEKGDRRNCCEFQKSKECDSTVTGWLSRNQVVANGNDSLRVLNP